METPFTNSNVLPLRHNELYDFFAKFIIITAELVNLTRVFFYKSIIWNTVEKKLVLSIVLKS